ncbi:MAG TPA: site-specific DNA-methyltransferase [Candidatus Bathyarchaeia archaeon]|nr:site-specific DNA-methyltransferase [Candidatus Bathyarchaeia archaeon]
MTRDYRVVIGDSCQMTSVPDSSVHLVVTSPPYPMVAIWDDFFATESSTTYDQMHSYLDQVWREVARILAPGGIACINIGDATRTVAGVFRLYPNHSRIIESFEKLGLVTLPYLLWKKPTTKPHYKGKGAFLGSGFLPPNAYVTIDMEHILIFRNGPPRKFESKDATRYTSKYTKKERDEWFSQVWNIKGARQNLDGFERRIAAFPEEIPRRLIRMFSITGDTVVDPFLGSGTTLKVAMNLARKCIGYEKLPEMKGIITRRLAALAEDVEFTESSKITNELLGLKTIQ